eukprot:gene8995-1094_t
MTSDLNKQCRICFEEEGDLISPCYCKGTMKHVHRECLNHWRNVAPSPKSCENCKYKYKLLKPIFKKYHYIFITIITLILYTALIFGCALLNDSVFPVIEFISQTFDKLMGVSRKEYYRKTRNDVFKVESTHVNVDYLMVFYFLIKSGFMLWMIECVRELYITFKRTFVRFTAREKFNMVMKIFLFVATFPSLRPKILGDQKYWVIAGKFFIMAFLVSQLIWLYLDVKFYYLKYFLKIDEDFILNYDENEVIQNENHEKID